MANALSRATSGALPETGLSWEEAVARFLDWAVRGGHLKGDSPKAHASDLRIVGALLSERFGIIDPRDVRDTHIEEVLRCEADRGMSEGTRRRRFDAVRQLYKYAVRHGLADLNPTDDMKPPRRSYVETPMVPPGDFCRLRLEVRNVLEDVLLLTLGLTGARHSELLKIDLSDIDRYLPGVTFRNAKGGKRRTVPLSPRLALAWDRYEQARPATNCPAAFVTQDGKRLTKRVLYRMWHRWLRGAGLADSGYVPHSCRVTFCTFLDRTGADDRTIGELMGHGPKSMPERYTRTDMPRKIVAVAWLEEALLAPGQGVFGDCPVEIAGAGVQIGGRGIEPGVPEHLRQGVQVTSALQHETRERMPQRVEGAASRDRGALEGTSQYGRQALAAQRGVGDRREQPVVFTQRAQLQPVGQGIHEAGGQGQQPALSALAALDPHGPLGQIDGRHLQGQQFRLAQAREHEQPQYGPVAEGMGEGRLSLRGGEEPVALFYRQPGRKGTFALRDGDAEEWVGVCVPIVPQVLPQGPERRETAGDAVRPVPLRPEPRDVAANESAVNVLRLEAPAGITETADEQPEVGGVGGNGQRTAVTLDFQI